MDIIEEINRLKKEKNAVILSHYYVDDDVKEVADYTGDSYYLSKVAKETDADIIVLSGVSFMGESAKLLNPEKTVLMPDSHADCPMAHMATVEYIEKVKEKYNNCKPKYYSVVISLIHMHFNRFLKPTKKEEYQLNLNILEYEKVKSDRKKYDQNRTRN